MKLDTLIDLVVSVKIMFGYYIFSVQNVQSCVKAKIDLFFHYFIMLNITYPVSIMSLALITMKIKLDLAIN